MLELKENYYSYIYEQIPKFKKESFFATPSNDRFPKYRNKK